MQWVHSSKSDTRCFSAERDDIAARARTTLASYKDERMKEKISFKDLSRRLWGRPNCKTLTASTEMRQELNYLKKQYKTVCEQESVLRSQIAMLTAEIVLIETKEYHKSPMVLPKISVDPISIKIPIKRTQSTIERPECIVRQLSKISRTRSKIERIKKFPPVDPAPSRASTKIRKRPSFNSRHADDRGRCRGKNIVNEEDNESECKWIKHDKKECSKESSQYCPYCSIFCHPPPSMNPRAYRTPPPAFFTEFRLPKVNVKPTINNLTRKQW